MAVRLAEYRFGTPRGGVLWQAPTRLRSTRGYFAGLLLELPYLLEREAGELGGPSVRIDLMMNTPCTRFSEV